MTGGGACPTRDWSAGSLGLYKGGGQSAVTQFDDFKVGFDNNSDGDITDAGDDILVDDDFNSNQTTLTYDDNGNLTNDGVHLFEYDAWNRLRKAILTDGADETTVAEYEYYGDNRRSRKIVQNRGPENIENDGGDTTVAFYYDNKWRIVETRNGSNQTTFQYLWGTRYTDELLWIEVNGDPTESNDTNPDDQSGESTADARYFVHQDRNWNVVALSDADGDIVERYSYTPYGSFVVLMGDSGDGELCSASLNSSVGNPFAHQGLPFDQEKGSYQNRWREYINWLQRFAQPDPLMRQETPFRNRSSSEDVVLEQRIAARRLLGHTSRRYDQRCHSCGSSRRDPLGIRDGLSPYQYERSNPTMHSDPSGLVCDPPNGCSWSPDRPCGYDFTNACNSHDGCYCTCGYGQNACDDELCDDMHWTCRYYYNDAWLCHRLADIYCVAVRRWGEGPYCDAQIAGGCTTLPPGCP